MTAKAPPLTDNVSNGPFSTIRAAPYHRDPVQCAQRAQAVRHDKHCDIGERVDGALDAGLGRAVEC